MRRQRRPLRRPEKVRRVRGAHVLLSSRVVKGSRATGAAEPRPGATGCAGGRPRSVRPPAGLRTCRCTEAGAGRCARLAAQSVSATGVRLASAPRSALGASRASCAPLGALFVPQSATTALCSSRSAALRCAGLRALRASPTYTRAHDRSWLGAAQSSGLALSRDSRRVRGTHFEVSRFDARAARPLAASA